MATFGKLTNGASVTNYSVVNLGVSAATPLSSGTATKGTARVSVSSGSTDAKFAIYADSSNSPGVKLAESDIVTISNTSEQEVDFPFSGANQVAIVSGTQYWVGVGFNDPGTPTIGVSRDATASLRTEQNAFTWPNLPEPFGTPSFTGGGPVDAYVTYTEAGGGRVAATGRVASTRTNSVLDNGNIEQRPAVITAPTSTANRWIDGTAAGSTAQTAYVWAAPSAGSGVGANADIGFDTTIFRSGTASLRLSTLNASGAVTAASIKSITPSAATLYETFPLLPNTSYTFIGYIRTNNVASGGALVQVREASSTGSTLATNSTDSLSGTDTNWRQVTVTFTTNASTAFGYLLLRNNVAGNVSDAWFDDMTLVPATTGRVAASGRVAA